jgi:hypothetical protein
MNVSSERSHSLWMDTPVLNDASTLETQCDDDRCPRCLRYRIGNRHGSRFEVGGHRDRNAKPRRISSRQQEQ